MWARLSIQLYQSFNRNKREIQTMKTLIHFFFVFWYLLTTQQSHHATRKRIIHRKPEKAGRRGRRRSLQADHRWRERRQGCPIAVRTLRGTGDNENSLDRGMQQLFTRALLTDLRSRSPFSAKSSWWASTATTANTARHRCSTEAKSSRRAALAPLTSRESKTSTVRSSNQILLPSKSPTSSLRSRQSPVRESCRPSKGSWRELPTTSTTFSPTEGYALFRFAHSHLAPQ